MCRCLRKKAGDAYGTTSVGQIGLDLVVNQKQFNKQMSGIQSLAKKTGATLAAAFSIKKIVDFGKQCIELGSDLEEVQNVVDVTFPNMTAKVNEFAQSAASSFGLSETMAKKYTGTFGAMAKAFGFTESAAYDMGATLTGLAGDVASFYNITQDEAYTKLKSVFTGETETLKDLGVVMTQSALDSYALANGFGKTTSAMSEAEKVALRYAFVQDQLSAAQGDFARTSDSWANQVKVLQLQFESLKSTIGQGLISAFTPVIKTVNTLLGKVQALATSFKQLMEGLFGVQTAETSALASAAETASAAATETADSTGATANNLKKASRFLTGFDKINKVQETSDTSSGSSGNTSAGVQISTNAVSTTSDEADAWAGKFTKLSASLDRLKESFGRLADVVKESFSWCWENILKPFGNWVLDEAVPAVLDLFSAAFDALTAVLEALQPLWQWIWDNMLKPLAEFVGDAFVIFLEKITELLTKFSDWCEEHQTTIQTIAIIIGSFAAAWSIVTIAVGLWNAVATIATTVTTLLAGAISFLTSPIGLVIVVITALIAAGVLLYKNWDTVKEVALNVWEKIKRGISDAVAKIKEVFGSIVGWFQEKYNGIKNVFASVGTWFKDKFTSAYKSVTNAFSNIGNFFSSVYDTVKSKFKAIGTAVGDAIGGSFKSVMNGVLSTVENTVNKAINFINGAIGVINKVPGVNISKVKTVSLPRLAQGGYVKANTPQLAVIGDNRHQGEVVAPEDKLTEMAMNAVRAASGNDYSLEILKVLKEILKVLQELDLNIVIDGKKLKDIIVEKINKNTRQTGVCEIIT